MVLSTKKIIIKKGDSGATVEDLQNRLSSIGYLKSSNINSYYDDYTAKAVEKFSIDKNMDPTENVTEKIWALLVDASYKLGDRNLFLRMPYFHGNDVLELQNALGSLGFAISHYDGIFGPSTEKAVRLFQINMGLPTDGIIGYQTFIALRNLKFTWQDKKPLPNSDIGNFNVFWRASKVLEDHSICIYGTEEFTRDVAFRLSNLARATNPFSKVLSSTDLSIAPDKSTLLVHIVLPEDKYIYSETNNPCVLYSDDSITEDNENLESNSFIKRLISALAITKDSKPPRIAIQLPSKNWQDAGEDRSAQHFAITILDTLCNALYSLDNTDK